VTTAYLDRHQAALAYALAAIVSLPAGLAIVRSQHGVSMLILGLLVLGGVVLLFSVPPQTLFLGWLFVAPLFQTASDETPLGRALGWALFTVPAGLLLVLTILRRDTSGARFVDLLPAAYVAFVFLSIVLTTSNLQTNPSGTLRYFYVITALGPVVYYFLAFGPGAAIRTQAIVGVMVAAATIQGGLAIVDYLTGWNPWGFTAWQTMPGRWYDRAVATLANPGLLGAFLGTAIVFATAALTHGGPRSFRRPAVVVVLICVPGLMATLTRGPIIATACTVTLLLVHGRLRLLGLGLIAATALAVIALLPTIRTSGFYEQRVVERTNVLVRRNIQDWSLKLAAQRPLVGWGYGSFDRVKNASGFSASGGLPIAFVLTYTSHNTYLTMLVELGFVGVLLFALPFAILSWKALARARLPDSPDRWLAAATLGSLMTVALTASTLDFRFFHFGTLLSWLLLALLRRVTMPKPMVVTTSGSHARA
jgi:O-antigen ligase